MKFRMIKFIVHGLKRYKIIKNKLSARKQVVKKSFPIDTNQSFKHILVNYYLQNPIEVALKDLQ